MPCSTYSFRSKASRRRAQDICAFARASRRLVREREIRMRLTAGGQSHSPRDDGETSTKTIPVHPRHESPQRLVDRTAPSNLSPPGLFLAAVTTCTSARNVDDLLARRSNEGVRVASSRYFHADDSTSFTSPTSGRELRPCVGETRVSRNESSALACRRNEGKIVRHF